MCKQVLAAPHRGLLQEVLVYLQALPNLPAIIAFERTVSAVQQETIGENRDLLLSRKHLPTIKLIFLPIPRLSATNLNVYF